MKKTISQTIKINIELNGLSLDMVYDKTVGCHLIHVIDFPSGKNILIIVDCVYKEGKIEAPAYVNPQSAFLFFTFSPLY